MAKLHEKLLDPKPWSGLIMGNHAVARGLVEAGVQVITTYPGSPTPEIAALLNAVPREKRPYYFEYSTNEKVATEVAAGASLNGHLSAVFFKSVGLNVASDTLVQLPLLELIGGMVIVLGDDPGLNSSQNEQDNRHFSRMSYAPMFEPATPQEAYEMVLEAARLAARHKGPIFVRMTTHINHCKEVVDFGPIPERTLDWTPRFDKRNGPYIPLTSAVVPMKLKALAKLAAYREYSEQCRFNRVHPPTGKGDVGGRRLGLISSSLPTLSLLENLDEADQALDLLQVGLTHPLPPKMIADFLQQHDEVLIVEELDRVMELEIKALALDAGLGCRILSRRDTEELLGELTPDRTWKLLSDNWPEAFAPKKLRPTPLDTVTRLPQLCPGCGHRSAFHAVKQAIDESTISVADIGCHTMGFWPPYELGEVLFCMGHSSGTGAGLALGNKTRKVISFVGDSTLFHAGLPGLLNAVVNNHDLTLIVMENGTTAMTGHQPRPGAGEVGDKIPLPEMFRALGVKQVFDVDAYDQLKLIDYLKQAMENEGFSIVIARHPCMLKFSRQQRKRMPDIKLPQVQIKQDKCDRSHVCLEQFGCPSFYRHDDGSITVHGDLCIGDGSCLQTCPVQAIWRPRPAT